MTRRRGPFDGLRGGPRLVTDRTPPPMGEGARLKPCAEVACRALVPQGTRRCPSCADAWEKRERARLRALARTEERRGTSSERGYGRRWRALRLLILHRHPVCAIRRKCNGAIATEVDHKTPHKGDRRLMYDPDNLQPACKPCHSWKTSTEDGGFGRRHDRS